MLSDGTWTCVSLILVTTQQSGGQLTERSVVIEEKPFPLTLLLSIIIAILILAAIIIAIVTAYCLHNRR